MVVTNNKLTSIKSSALDAFDDQTHIAFGDDNTTPAVGDTALGNEVIRKAFDEAAVKNTGNGTYDFSTTVGLTEANGETLREIGLFDAASSGNMAVRNLLPSEISKTLSLEVSASIRVSITVENV